jgi:glycosyltransferase A (GT-A) superfamily protein (DUF2064 family)
MPYLHLPAHHRKSLRHAPRPSAKGILIIFAKVPIMGIAKKRLAHDIGAWHAHQIYTHLLANTLRAAATASAELGWALEIHTPRIPLTRKTIRHIFARSIASSPPWCLRTQQGYSLGDKMRHALNLHTHNRTPCLLIGSDIAQLRAPAIMNMASYTQQYNIAFGPAYDGGFWAIGSRMPLPPRALADVRWSSAHAFTDTLSSLPAHWRIGLGGMHGDVDTAHDLPRVSHLRCLPSPRPHLLD